MADVIIIPTNNGPYRVQGRVTLMTEGGNLIESVAEETWRRRCGQSAAKPSCDGSHERIGFPPDLDAERATAEAAAPTDGYEDVCADEEIPEGQMKGVRLGDAPHPLRQGGAGGSAGRSGTNAEHTDA